MRFRGLDLNLLVALDVLLKERNVSVAAVRLHLSQSAMSGALTRLRDYFGDPLLLRSGQRLTLTPRAEALIEPVRSSFLQIENSITQAPSFDPSTSELHFTIVASDYGLMVVVAPALRVIAREAPRMTFLLRPVTGPATNPLEQGEADIVITGSASALPVHPAHFVLEDDYVVVAWAENEKVGDTLDLETYFALGHISIQLGATPYLVFENWLLRHMKCIRRIEVTAPSFSDLPTLTLGTERLATLHRRHAELLVQGKDLRVLELPFEGPRLTQAIQWHRLRAHDPALLWVVEKLEEAALPRAEGN